MDGRREVLGVAVGDSEDKAFWSAFCRTLRSRGLTEVRLATSCRSNVSARETCVLLASA